MIDSKERHFSDLSPPGFFLDLGTTTARPASWKRCQHGGAKEGEQYSYATGRRLRFMAHTHAPNAIHVACNTKETRKVIPTQSRSQWRA
jgi:hypothetical protein